MSLTFGARQVSDLPNQHAWILKAYDLWVSGRRPEIGKNEPDMASQRLARTERQ